MQDLRLVAVTPGRTHLVLEDADSKQYRVPIDERLAAALRSDRARPGKLEIALEMQLTPRDIQARIRSGQGAEEVARAAGVPVERIERYASPVLAERAHVAGQAQAAPSRRQSGGSAPSLGDLVEARLAEQRVAADSVTWDAWRTDENRWTVRLRYLAGSRERYADWVFDPRGRVLAAADDEARWLVDETGPERDDEDEAAPMRRLASVPKVEADGAEADGQPADEVYDHEADEAGQDGAASAGQADRPAPDAEPRTARQAARGGRRPAVPSWDDIMFGARKHD